MLLELVQRTCPQGASPTVPREGMLFCTTPYENISAEHAARSQHVASMAAPCPVAIPREM